MKKFLCFQLFMALFCPIINAQSLGKELVLIETPYGNMKIRLYEETPKHKENFLKLVREKYYDSLMFHRVINQFMIQGGDHLSKRAQPGDSLGHGDIGYMVPAEFNPKLIHKKGVIAAARESDEINPAMGSSATQFYVVMGKKRTAEDLKKYEERINRTRYNNVARTFIRSEEGKKMKQQYDRLKSAGNSDSAAILNSKIEEEIKKEYSKKEEYKFSAYQTETYTTIGGTPHLDGTYTVFGEVVEGLEVIDKIAAVKTDKRDRPLQDIRMKVKIIE